MQNKVNGTLSRIAFNCSSVFSHPSQWTRFSGFVWPSSRWQSRERRLMYKQTEALESFIDKTVGFCSKWGFSWLFFFHSSLNYALLWCVQSDRINGLKQCVLRVMYAQSWRWDCWVLIRTMAYGGRKHVAAPGSRSAVAVSLAPFPSLYLPT